MFSGNEYGHWGPWLPAPPNMPLTEAPNMVKYFGAFSHLSMECMNVF